MVHVREKHWADEIAGEILKTPGPHEISTGISPSGEIHIGNLREVITADVVYRALVTGGALGTCAENDAVEWVKPAHIPWGELAFPSTHAALTDFLTRS